MQLRAMVEEDGLRNTIISQRLTFEEASGVQGALEIAGAIVELQKIS